MVMPERGRCSFGVLGFWHTLPRLQDSQSPECSDRGPRLGPWECARNGRNREKRLYPALFLANSLFHPPPPARVPPFFSLFQPIFTVFYPFSSYHAFLSLFRLYSLRSNLFAQSHLFFFTLFHPFLSLILTFFSLFHVFTLCSTHFLPFSLFSHSSAYFLHSTLIFLPFLFLKFVFHLFSLFHLLLSPSHLFLPSLFHLFSLCSSGFSPYSTNFPYSTLFLCNPSIFFPYCAFLFSLLHPFPPQVEKIPVTGPQKLKNSPQKNPPWHPLHHSNGMK